jgi:hypothetical protein
VPDYEVKSFNDPDEVLDIPNVDGGVLDIGGGKVGRMVLKPGWKWSNDVKPLTNTEWCEAPHFDYQASGTVHVVMQDGTEFDTHAGDVVVLNPGHDAWVVGEEDVEIIDWGGAHIWGKRQG